MRHWKWFFKAIKDGYFTPRVSDEDIKWATKESVGNWVLLIPMVCFCDIPLRSSVAHRRAYGEYVIGLSKAWGKSAGLNPLLYVSDGSMLEKSITRSISRVITKTNLVPADFGKLWPVIPYIKPDEGFQKVSLKNRETLQYKVFEKEMEWRYVPKSWEILISSHPTYDKEAVTAMNERVASDQLSFTSADIDVVLVKTKPQKDTILVVRPELKGRVKLWSELRA